MSAFIVDEKCLNNIVSFLSFTIELYMDDSGKCTKLLKKEGYNLAGKSDCNRLFQAMLNLNIEAVESSYTDDELVKGVCISMINDSKDYSYESSPNPGINQVLKSLHYWLWECAAGEPMESSILYVTFKKIENIILPFTYCNTTRGALI